MKRKITRQSLDELQKTLSTLSHREQKYYIGGGTGTQEDPYTYSEYQNLLHSGAWHGGYVMGSTETYARDESGTWVRSEYSQAIYIESDNHLLKDVVVIGRRKNNNVWRDYDDYSGVWDSTLDSDSDDYSGMIYPSDDWDNNNTANMSGSGGGGGTSTDKKGNTSLPWSRSVAFLQKYGVTLKSMGYEDAEMYLGQTLFNLSKSKTFISLMERTHTHGVPIIIHADQVTQPSSPDVKRSGVTSYRPNPNGSVSIKLDVNYLSDSDSIGVSETIIHEMIHARLQGVFSAYGIIRSELIDKTSSSYAKLNSEEFKVAYPGIHDYYSRCQTSNEIEQADHEIMAIHYRPMVVKILQEIYPDMATEDCEALSWAGLKGTRTWEVIDDSIKDEIIKTINKYKRGNE